MRPSGIRLVALGLQELSQESWDRSIKGFASSKNLIFFLLSFRPGHYGTIGRAIPAPVVPKPGMQVIFTPLVLNFE